MSKRKPDQTVNLRIELQDYERKALASYQMAQAIKDMADAIDKLTSFENLYILTTIAEVATGKEILPGTPNDVYILIDYIRDYVQKNEEEDRPLWLDILANLPTAFGGLVD
jgi:ribosomal protein L18E